MTLRALCTAGFVLWCASARAGDPVTDAEAMMSHGESFYGKGDYESAYAVFNAARVLVPYRPGPNLWTGLSLVALHRCPEALPFLTRYVEAKKGEARPEALRALETCREHGSTPGCPRGQMISDDTAGHCCWPGQSWNGRQCIGTPATCPESYIVDVHGTGCIQTPCPDGRTREADGVHCCWPGQGWSRTRSSCTGTPRCSPPLALRRDNCVKPGDEPAGTHACKADDPTECRLQCDLGHAESCWRLSRGAPEAVREQLVDRACSWGHVAACQQRCGGSQPQGCMKGCASGDAHSCPFLSENECFKGGTLTHESLGEAFEAGNSWVLSDMALAVRFYQRGCDCGSARACRRLANLYVAGRGVGKDFSRAASLLRAACKLGETSACSSGSLGRAGDR